MNLLQYLLGKTASGIGIRTGILTNGAQAKPFAAGLNLPHRFAQSAAAKVAVGTPVAGCPPLRSVREELPHTAPASSVWRQSEHSDMGGRRGVGEAICLAGDRSVPTSSACALFDCAVGSPSATFG